LVRQSKARLHICYREVRDRLETTQHNLRHRNQKSRAAQLDLITSCIKGSFSIRLTAEMTFENWAFVISRKRPEPTKSLVPPVSLKNSAMPVCSVSSSTFPSSLIAFLIQDGTSCVCFSLHSLELTVVRKLY